jgi:hypothetical protein
MNRKKMQNIKNGGNRQGKLIFTGGKMCFWVGWEGPGIAGCGDRAPAPGTGGSASGVAEGLVGGPGSLPAGGGPYPALPVPTPLAPLESRVLGFLTLNPYTLLTLNPKTLNPQTPRPPPGRFTLGFIHANRTEASGGASGRGCTGGMVVTSGVSATSTISAVPSPSSTSRMEVSSAWGVGRRGGDNLGTSSALPGPSPTARMQVGHARRLSGLG